MSIDSGDMNPDEASIGARLITQLYALGSRNFGVIDGGYLSTLSGSEQTKYIEQVWQGVQTAVEFGMANGLEADPFSEEGKLLIMAGAVMGDGLSGHLVMKDGAERIGTYEKLLCKEVAAYKKDLRNKFVSTVEVEAFKRAQQMMDETDRETSGNIGQMYGQLIGTLVGRLERVQNAADNLMESLVEEREEKDKYKKIAGVLQFRNAALLRKDMKREAKMVSLEGEIAFARSALLLMAHKPSDKVVSYRDARRHYSQSLYLEEDDTWDEVPESDKAIKALGMESDAEVDDKDDTFRDEVKHLFIRNCEIEIPEVLVGFDRDEHKFGALDF